MNNLQISISVFALALATIALLYVILEVTKKPHRVWRAGLFTCMSFLGVGVILIFIPPLTRYASLAGMAGVFLMICAVAYVRWKEAKGHVFEGKTRNGFAIRAGIFLIAGGLLAAPFFTIFSNQQEVKNSQFSIYGLLLQVKNGVVNLSGQIGILIDMLERDHLERQEFKEELLHQVGAVQKDVKHSLQNDVTTKKRLKSAEAKAARPVINITAPTPKGIPAGEFRTPDVKPVSVPRRGRKVGGNFDLDPDQAELIGGRPE